MTFLRRYAPWMVLAACIAAALVFRRFAYVAWYPVLMSAAVAGGFAFSLLGREPLCLALARKIPPHVLPEGAERYCRAYTALWAAWLAVNGLVACATIYAPGPVWRLERAGLDVPCAWVIWNCCLSYGATGLIVLAERLYRRRRFAVTFHTSGSTARPKAVVKPFATLAKEVACHRARLPCLNAPGAKPVFLSTVEPQHLYGRLWRVLLPRAAGCAADPEVIRTPESLLAKMLAAERAVLVTTPSFLVRFCAYADQYDVPRNCVEVVSSGALLTAAASAAARRVFGVAPLEIFGSTETGGVAWRRQGGAALGDGFDWTVFGPVKVRADADGRLVVDSPFSFQRGFTMGDGAALAPDGRRFRLLGRRDRLVKIAEQRVSLPEMEEQMGRLAEVREAALVALDGPHGPYLGAVVALDPGAVDVAVGKRALARALRRRLLPVFPKGAVPKRYRFVREIPRNAQGKAPAARLRQILESNLVEPFVLDAVETEATWTAELVFDADAPYFKGHFPGCAVLPGVVQLGIARHFAEQFLRRAVALASVKKMKFTHVVVPGARVRLTLARLSDHEVSYAYRKGDAICSSGVMCF